MITSIREGTLARRTLLEEVTANLLGHQTVCLGEGVGPVQALERLAHTTKTDPLDLYRARRIR